MQQKQRFDIELYFPYYSQFELKLFFHLFLNPLIR
jgi:hypothetical protein